MVIKRAIITIVTLLALLSVLIYVGIPIPLSPFADRLERLTGSMLGRNVTIGGPVRLVVSLHPSLQIGDLTIDNPPDWATEQTFLRAHEGSGSIDLLALLRGKIRIESLMLDRVAIDLVTRSDRSTNFSFASSPQTSDDEPSGHEFTGLDLVSLSDIKIRYLDEFSGRHYIFTIDQAQGSGTPDTPLQLSASGNFGTLPYSVDIEGGIMADLLSGEGSWPLTKGRLLVGEISLEVNGALDLDRSGEGGFLSLALEGENLGDIDELFDFSFPDPGKFSLSTDIGVAPAFFQFTNLTLETRAGDIVGDLVVSLHDLRPLVGGNLSVMVTALQEFQPAPEQSSGSEATSEGGGAGEIELPWHLLDAFDTDLVIKVGDISAGGFKLGNIKTTISLVDGELIIPLDLNLVDMPIRARLEASGGAPSPGVSGFITSPGADLGLILEQFDTQAGWDGELGSLIMKGASSGISVDELLRNLSLSLSLKDSTLTREGESVISADDLAIDLQSQKALLLSAQGSLLDTVLDFRASMADSALRVDLQACDSELTLEGRKAEEYGGASQFELELVGEKLCGLLHPVARFIDENPRFSATASGNLSNEGFKLDVEQISVADLKADGHLLLQQGAGELPRITGAIRSPRIDLAHILAQMEEETSEEAPPETDESVFEDEAEDQQQYEQVRELIAEILATEITPVKRFLSTEVQLKIEVREVITGMIGVSDVALSIEAEQGKLRHSPFQARIGGSLFNGSVAIDLSDAVPSAHLDLETDNFSLDELLGEFNFEEIPEIRAAHVGLDMSFEGKTVKDLLLKAHYHARLEEGRIEIDREPLAPLLLTISEADYVAFPYQPAMLTVRGEVNDLPVRFESTSSGFFARGTEKPVILSLLGSVGDNRFDAEGRINRHKDSQESFRLSSTVYGSRMDTLNDILGLNLPPLGPFEIGGALASRAEKSVGLYDMEVKIGASSLWGEMILTVLPGLNEQGKPRINLESRLEALTVQLNDFQFGQWSPVTGTDQEPPTADSRVSAVSEPVETSYNLFSAEVAERIDATLNIDVQEVLSGEDRLGQGNLVATLEKGVFILDDLQLDIPGGTVQIKGKLLPQDENIGVELLMNIEDFDYGILVRRTKPESTLKGNLNLMLELQSEVAKGASLNDNINGRFRFGIVPEEFRAGILDLWAVNIITAALPVMMKGSSSVVNCLAGDFTLEESLMEPELFLLDTSNMRVNGKGKINLRTNEINFVLKPKPKSAQFFSLATPVAVTGSILNPDIGVTTAAVIATIFRQPISIVTVPFQWLFTDNLEKDGKTVCSNAMQWVREASDGGEQESTPE